MSSYKFIVIETYENIGEPAAEKIRARPLPGQGFSTNMKVECSSKMREGFPPGTKFKIRAKKTRRENGTPFLYSYYNWDFQVLSNAAARAYLRNSKETRKQAVIQRTGPYPRQTSL